MIESRKIALSWGMLMALVCGLLLTGVGCQTPVPTPQGETPRQGSNLINVGDKLEVTFTDTPQEFSGVITVREDGMITLPLNQTVKAAGRTWGDVQKEIHGLYVPKFYRRMTVVIVAADRFYFVGGEVKQPSRQPYTTEMTVLRAIQSAGDFTDFANKKAVEVIRTNGKKDVVNALAAQRDPSLDLPIYPGDQIIVNRRWF
ncbi:MAG: polysaccharide biosynthesis/export family protein [Verrucomicrobiota bacterium]|nr:polysaccharide biosynthesis/export family protein [Verrucomicrobiota bacterium]